MTTFRIIRNKKRARLLQKRGEKVIPRIRYIGEQGNQAQSDDGRYYRKTWNWYIK